MFSPKEAGQVAANALEVHAGQGDAREFQLTFEPWYSNIKPPELKLTLSRSDDFAWTTGRLLHVQSPKVLGALGLAAEAGDRQALDLIVDVVTDRHVRPEARMTALSTLAQFFPSEAGEIAIALKHDDAVADQLAKALVRHSRSPNLLPALECLAMRPEYLKHEAAIEALVQLGEPGSEVLARCMVSRHEQVRRTAGNAVLSQKLVTPAIVDAVNELSQTFRSENDAHLAMELREALQRSGFRWKLQDIVQQTLSDLQALDQPQAAGNPPARFGLGRIFRTLNIGERPEPGLLAWERDKNQPFTREERVAQSLVKLVMLRPVILFDLADSYFGELGVHYHIGSFGPASIDIARAEQRDSRLFVPLSGRLREDPAFRDRVRSVVTAFEA